MSDIDWDDVDGLRQQRPALVIEALTAEYPRSV